MGLACCLAGVVLPPTGIAMPVAFNFAGIITSKEDPQSFMGTGFAAGTAFTGSLYFDAATAAADAYPDNPELGLYAFLLPPEGAGNFLLQITAGGHVFTSGTYGNVTVQAPPAGTTGTDYVAYGGTIGSYDGNSLSPTFTAFNYGVGFGSAHDLNEAAGNDRLPVAVPNFSDFDYATMAIGAQDPTFGINFSVAGIVTEVTLVPEPGTAVLLLGALAWMAARLRNRRS